MEAMRLLWTRAKLVVEPSGAVALAAACRMGREGRLADRRVGVILSGGNVDVDQLPFTHQARVVTSAVADPPPGDRSQASS